MAGAASMRLRIALVAAFSIAAGCGSGGIELGGRPLDDWFADLGASDRRERAVSELARFIGGGDPDAVAASRVLEALGGAGAFAGAAAGALAKRVLQSGPLAAASAATLARLGERGLLALAGLVTEADEGPRALAIETLASVGSRYDGHSDAAGDALRSALALRWIDDPATAPRAIDATRALGLLEDEDAAALAELLDADSESLYRAAALAIAAIGPAAREASLEPLLRRLGEGRRDDAIFAALAAVAPTDQEVTRSIASHLDARFPSSVRVAALRALATQAPSDVARAAADAVLAAAEPASEIALAAAAALAGWSRLSERAIDELVSALERSAAEQRAALRALGKAGAPNVVDSIRASIDGFLASENVELAALAAAVLAPTEPERALRTVAGRALDIDVDAARATIAALALLAPAQPDAEAELVRWTAARPRVLCLEAADALGRAARSTQRVDSALRRLLQDVDRSIRQQAMRALIEIGARAREAAERRKAAADDSAGER